MGAFNGHLIGYSQLKDQTEAVSNLEPIYATLASKSDLGYHRVRYEQIIIQIAQPQGEIVHYVRIPVASIQWINDTPLTPNHEKRIQHAEQALQIVKAWLLAQGFIVRNAAVAYPRDYRLLEGNARFLDYDKERGYFLKLDNADQVASKTEA